MKKLLLSSVMLLFLCTVSFAQTEKQPSKLTARMEALKLAEQVQRLREQEKILEVQIAKEGSNTSAQAIQKFMAEKLALEESRNKANAANVSNKANAANALNKANAANALLIDPRAN